MMSMSIFPFDLFLDQVSLIHELQLDQLSDRSNVMYNDPTQIEEGCYRFMVIEGDANHYNLPQLIYCCSGDPDFSTY